MDLLKKIDSDFLKAFKSKDEFAVSVLRMVKSALKNRAIEKGFKDGALPDEEVMAVIKTEIKKRNDSVESYRAGGRQDLVDKEKREIDLLSKYLPEQMSEDQVRRIIQEVVTSVKPAGQADFGKVMGQAMAKLKGQADGQLVSALVKEILNNL